ncbi:MAG: DUF1028 domain-containing protein [Candidatus Saccharimonadales bacterium]
MIKNTSQNFNIATFSIVARSKDGQSFGVAVASKFLAVGSYVPAATVHGALATQASTNMGLRTEGMNMLEEGVSAEEVLKIFFESDSKRNLRQAGVVDAKGLSATYTGEDCQPWAGGHAEAHPSGSFAIQGNLLAGPEVVESMVAAWCNSDTGLSLAWRLMAALEAGQAAGGDSRGDQAAALYVVEKDKGFEGTSDIAVDLRCDDSSEPIKELKRLLQLHDELFK